MKHKQLFFFLCYLLLYCVSLGAQIRGSVVVVQPKLSDEGISAYRAISTYFRNQNLNDLADYFDSMTKGGFGSGYLSTDHFGRSVFVTNRHVVTFADSATITVTYKEGKEVSISLENCPILYEDPDIDFAIILLPEGALEGTPRLELAESLPPDGETVWSAGYPGLFGKPSWQLAKGVITNGRVVVESIGLPSYAIYTQHSAPIDPGNSGGPLLTGDPTDPSSFRVVGINTWVIPGRQSANFAVSLEMLREAFLRIPDPNSSMPATERVGAKANELVASLNSSTWSRFEASRYIASRMVMRQGWNAFTSLLSSMKDDELKTWVERFIGESPEETIRQAISKKIHNSLYKEGQTITLESTDKLPDVEGEARIRTGVKVGKTIYYFDWFEESGNWRIFEAGIPSAGLSGPKQRVEKAPAPPVTMPEGGYPFPAGLTIGVGISSIPTIYGWRSALNQSIGYQFGITKFASLGGSLVVDAGAAYIESGSQAMPLIISLQGEGRIGVPIRLRNMMLFPFAFAGVRAGLATSDSEILRISIEGDAGLMLRPSSKWSIGLSLGANFATDVGLRLEGIPVKFFIVF